MATQRPTYGRADTDLISTASPISKKEPVVTTSNLDIGAASGSDTKDSAKGSQPLFANSRPEELFEYDEASEVHYNVPVETAKDLVTEIIHADDDTSLNPWTFRMWFLGELRIWALVKNIIIANITLRYWTLHLWWCARYHLLLQTSDALCFCNFRCCYILCARRVYGLHHPKKRIHWQVA
jgi:hypothetical protein